MYITTLVYNLYGLQAIRNCVNINSDLITEFYSGGPIAEVGDTTYYYLDNFAEKNVFVVFNDILLPKITQQTVSLIFGYQELCKY